MSHKANEKDTEKNQKARQLIDKDIPDVNESTGRKQPDDQEPQPFRPDENVDNQKSAKSRPTPSHNTSIKDTPIQGAQLAKEKRAHKKNIDKKSAQANPKGSE